MYDQDSGDYVDHRRANLVDRAITGLSGYDMGKLKSIYKKIFCIEGTPCTN